MIKKNIFEQLRSLLIYAIIFLLMLFVYNWLNDWMNEATREFVIPIPVFYISPLLMILFGIALSFERIIVLIHEVGALNFNWTRYIVIVLPLTFISFFYAIYYSQILGRFTLAIFMRPTVMTVAQVMQGFLIVSCFSRTKNKDEEYEARVG